MSIGGPLEWQANRDVSGGYPSKATMDASVGVWKTLPERFGFGSPGSGASTTSQLVYGGGVVTLAAANSAAAAFYLDPADYAITGYTTKIRLRATCVTNAVAPACTFTVDLFPVATWGGASNAQPSVATVGTSVRSVSFASPGASNGGAVAVSAAANFPTAGFYVLAITASVAPAANSFTTIVPTLQFQQV